MQPFPEAPTVGSCSPGAGVDLAGFPTWYKYLDCFNGDPQIDNINDVWNIAAAILEIVLYIAGVAAVIFMVIGGIRYITSQGQPDQTKRARQSLIYAVVGLVVSMIARAVIQLIFNAFNDGGSFI